MFLRDNNSRTQVFNQQYPSLENLIEIINETHHQFPMVNDGKAVLSINFGEDGNPVRKVVRRSNYRQSYQMFSRKMNKTMSCESLIEFNGCYIMEMLPEIKRYMMQPAEIIYVNNGEKHRHIPDALIEINIYKKCFIEFKASRDLDDEELQMRTDLMKKHLPTHGYGYLVICDEQVTGVPLQNAKKLTHIQKTNVSKETLLKIKRVLEAEELIAIRDLIAILEKIPNIKSILYQLLRQGALGFDKETVITNDTEIYWIGVMQ